MYLKFITNLMPGRFSAYTIGPIILVRPRYKDDIGLLEHEKVHVKQFWRSFGTFGILYFFSKKHRLAYELEAYREQLKHSPKDLMTFAVFLATLYNLNISVDEALAALRSEK